MADKEDVGGQRSGARSAGASLARSAKIALLVFGILLGGLAIAAIFTGEQTTLPFDYEGFD